jgi:hypothetical protein
MPPRKSSTVHWISTTDQHRNPAHLSIVRFPGLMRPKILLPADIEDWPSEHRQIVLLHEVAHVKQLDCLTQMLMQLAKALHWFNPFIWIFYHQFLKERECACDDFVLKEGQKASDYAKLLLDIAVKTPPLRFSSLTTVAMARRSQLEGRVLAILDPKLSRRKINHLVVAIASVTAFVLVLPLAAIHPKMRTEAAVQMIIPTPHAIGEKSSLVYSAQDGENPEKEKNGPLTAGEMKNETSVPLLKIQSDLTNQDRPKQTSLKNHSERIVLQSLFEALKDEDHEVRIGAAETLGRMKRSEAIQPLTSALEDENWQVRMAAVEALGNIGRNDSVEPLLRALKDVHWQVRYEAAESLGELGDSRALTPLSRVLKDGNKNVRVTAVEAIGEIKD